ncbi:predicted protein [Aspergillus nidulans FGSC A4]|uniref:LysM domain-containing protein n=1 Tax=Emericella nidulans (strain FGSC A4 / ATCC 38163 / CBS 112.46 / NRRL 194 / M139) TaxID=227321 RepID=Q5B427_EMENI|nr:hypothetical protein [Aspergillus nidulans FGSC A4]EAA60745.1 predicted protein [Aspergillus nidulans FGSC A4]CBF76963.1 TPA: conserved hypothetical protein [Aspergillus nidulans FGSC A4]|eukprot:XP_662307.1 predicted protein [Aspergillus nidulans FGSC A4]
MTLLTVIDSDDLPPAILTPWTLLPTPTKLPLGWYEEGLQRIQELFSGDIPSWWFAGQVETSHFADWNSLPWWNCTFDQEHPILRLLSDEFLLGDTCDTVLPMPISRSTRSTHGIPRVNANINLCHNNASNKYRKLPHNPYDTAGPTQKGFLAQCKYVFSSPSFNHDKQRLQGSRCAGIYCADMATNYGVALETMYELNPVSNGDCSGFWPEYTYCIEAS